MLRKNKQTKNNDILQFKEKYKRKTKINSDDAKYDIYIYIFN